MSLISDKTLAARNVTACTLNRLSGVRNVFYGQRNSFTSLIHCSDNRPGPDRCRFSQTLSYCMFHIVSDISCHGQ